jgi:hypothetical protein
MDQTENKKQCQNYIRKKPSEFFTKRRVGKNLEGCISLCQYSDLIFTSVQMRWVAYPEGYDVGTIADSMVNGDDGFHAITASLTCFQMCL